MSDEKIIRLTDKLGPPETELERAAVEVLLNSIRSFKAETGAEPEGLVWVIMADWEDLVYRVGHLRMDGPSVRMYRSMASSILAYDAVAD